MCKSVRGAAFFGSSIHMACSFVFLFWFVFDTLISEININLWKCEPPEPKFSESYPLAHYLNLLFKLLYFTGLSVTGVYIFRGVERERPELLKYATLAFAIMQMIAVILFAIFFSIQWEAELDPPVRKLNIEAAQLVSEDIPVGESPVIIPPLNLPETLNNTSNGDPEKQPMNCCARTVTPLVSENVLEAPDINNVTTTSTTPMAPPPVKVDIEATTTTTTPATVATTTTTIPSAPEPATAAPCLTAECMHAQIPPIVVPPPRKLPHNLLVRLVLQMCFAVFNGLISVAYVIVLALYMLKL